MKTRAKRPSNYSWPVAPILPARRPYGAGRVNRYYTFKATLIGRPDACWQFVAAINEAAFVTSLNSIAGGQITLGRIDVYLLATAIIHRKARSLLKERCEGREVQFSPFELQEADEFPMGPAYDTGGLSIWLLDAAGAWLFL